MKGYELECAGRITEKKEDNELEKYKWMFNKSLIRLSRYSERPGSFLTKEDFNEIFEQAWQEHCEEANNG